MPIRRSRESPQFHCNGRVFGVFFRPMQGIAAGAAFLGFVPAGAGCLPADPGSRRIFIAMAAFWGYFFGLCKVSLGGRRWRLFHPPRLKRAIMTRLLYWVAGIAAVTFAVMSG